MCIISLLFREKISISYEFGLWSGTDLSLWFFSPPFCTNCAETLAESLNNLKTTEQRCTLSTLSMRIVETAPRIFVSLCHGKGEQGNDLPISVHISDTAKYLAY